MPEARSRDAAKIDISRPLDWRAQRARHLVAQRRCPSPRDDDRWTAALATFYRNRERNTGVLGSRSQSTPAGLAGAVRLAEDPSALMRGVIEARLLAEQSAEDIAHSTGLSAEAVAWYEFAFFDVRDRLEHPDYILLSVIGLRPAAAGEWAPMLWAWKHVAYLGGVATLEGVLGLASVGDPDTLGSLAVSAREAKRIMATQWIWAALTVVDPLDPSMVTRFAERVAQETSSEDADAGPNSRFLARAEAVIQAFTGQIGCIPGMRSGSGTPKYCGTLTLWRWWSDL